MKESNQAVPVESTEQPKLVWSPPELKELDFHRTEGGSGASPEGSLGGLFSGSQS